MLIRLSRFLLIVLVIFLTAISIPKYYWMVLGERSFTSRLSYSPILQDFLIAKVLGNKYIFEGPDGHLYNRTKADSLLPLTNYRILAAKGLMPDSLLGRELLLDEVRLNNIFIRIRPKQIAPPQIPVYPLFESKPPRLQLEIPKHYFRISDRSEFISARTNSINDSLSIKYTRALSAEGFKYPAREVFGNPNPRKPFDEGYFILDSSKNLFHLKMIDGLPFCKNIHVPDSINTKWLFIKELHLKEFYGVLITQNNHVYLLMYDNYRLQRIPSSDYIAEEDELTFRGNLFYRTISIYNKGYVKSNVTNRNYELIDNKSITRINESEKMVGQIFRYLFPFSITLKNANTLYINLNFSEYHLQSLFLGVIFFILTLFIMYKKKIKPIHIVPAALVSLVFGVYGFLGLLIFNYGIEE